MNTRMFHFFFTCFSHVSRQSASSIETLTSGSPTSSLSSFGVRVACADPLRNTRRTFSILTCFRASTARDDVSVGCTSFTGSLRRTRAQSNPIFPRTQMTRSLTCSNFRSTRFPSGCPLYPKRALPSPNLCIQPEHWQLGYKSSL